jgi:hypothetical protein
MAQYWAEDGTLWAGAMTWGNVVEGLNSAIEAHGKRGMDYLSNTIDDMPSWFEVFNLPSEKVGIEVYYPYFSGDIHWGNEDQAPGDSIHSIITIKEVDTGINGPIYEVIRDNYWKARAAFRWPPTDITAAGLEERLRVHEAPLFITTHSGIDAAVDPDVDQWGYFYGSSERPDVHVREIISEDNMGTAYWRFDDTYGYQIGEGAAGDLPDDLKWEFGGAVFRIPDQGINEYAIYSSLWVLLPHGCEQSTHGCARVTMPFRDPGGVSIDGGPIMELLGEEIDMLFLPKGTRPGNVLELGDTFAFSGHVGPPLNSRVDVTVTSPGGTTRSDSFRANKIGWVYDPTFDFKVNETGRWTVDVQVVHDQDHLPSGTPKEVIQSSGHNEGTVLGTQGSYSFYVVEPSSRRLFITSPKPGFIIWPEGRIEPIVIRGAAPLGTTTVFYTIHDKGVVMGQGSVTPDAAGIFEVVYDPVALNKDFSFLSLTSHEGLWQGLADEVAINFLATGGGQAAANTVTLIGEEVFLGNEVNSISLPAVLKQSSE